VEDVHENHPAPSTAAHNAELVSNQNSTSPHAILNGRPITLAGPSLSIYHPIFQTFMQEYSADPAGISEEDIINASMLMVSSANYYEQEKNGRMPHIRPYLRHFFGNMAWEQDIVTLRRQWKPDGHISVACGLFKNSGLLPVTLIFELKNDVGAGHADPVAQAQHDYFLMSTSSQVGALDRLNDGPSDLVYSWKNSADEPACPHSCLG